MVDLGAAAGSRPITWLLDPGLPDVVRTLALGNPPRSLAPATPRSRRRQRGQTAQPARRATLPVRGGGRRRAATTQRPGARGRHRVGQRLAGPAARGPRRPRDPRPAVRRRRRRRRGRTRPAALPRGPAQRSGNELAPWGLPMTPAVASPGGYLDPAALGPTPRPLDRPVSPTDVRRRPRRWPRRPRGSPGDDLHGHGHRRPRPRRPAGPGRDAPAHPRRGRAAPARPRPAAAGRRAAVLLDTRAAATGFFEGLDVDWLHLTTVSDVAGRRRPRRVAGPAGLPAPPGRSELDSANFTSAAALIRAGETLQNVLTDNASVATTVADQAMALARRTATGPPPHGGPGRHRPVARLDRAADRLDQIDAPPAVTLSSTSGRFAATLTNGLDEPVTVQHPGAHRRAARHPRPGDGRDRAGRAHQRAAQRLLLDGWACTTSRSTSPTPTAGPLGSSDQVPIRSAQVSQVIWLILGTGVALLFGAIAVRLFAAGARRGPRKAVLVRRRA